MTSEKRFNVRGAETLQIETFHVGHIQVPNNDEYISLQFSTGYNHIRMELTATEARKLAGRLVDMAETHDRFIAAAEAHAKKKAGMDLVGDV